MTRPLMKIGVCGVFCCVLPGWVGVVVVGGRVVVGPGGSCGRGRTAVPPPPAPAPAPAPAPLSATPALGKRRLQHQTRRRYEWCSPE